MRLTFHVSPVALCSLLALAACSSGRADGSHTDMGSGTDLGPMDAGPVDSASPPDSAPPDAGPDDAAMRDASVPVPASCMALATTRCSRLDACTGSTFVAHDYGDIATCVARVGELCARSLLAPGTFQTDATISACGTALAAQTCADFVHGVTPSACGPMPGTHATGMPCAFAGQCATAFCAVAHGASCGTCQTEPVAGASCATFGCGRDLVCDAATSTCVAEGTAGAACPRAGSHCGAGLACVGATMTAMGTCQVEGATIGAHCDPRRMTAPDCDRQLGLFCMGSTMACAALTVGAAGTACGTAMPGVLCGAGGDCNGTTCRAAAADGTACDSGPGPFCLRPAVCIGAPGDGGVAGACALEDPLACG